MSLASAPVTSIADPPRNSKALPGAAPSTFHPIRFHPSTACPRPFRPRHPFHIRLPRTTVSRCPRRSSPRLTFLWRVARRVLLTLWTSLHPWSTGSASQATMCGDQRYYNRRNYGLGQLICHDCKSCFYLIFYAFHFFYWIPMIRHGRQGLCGTNERRWVSTYLIVSLRFSIMRTLLLWHPLAVPGLEIRGQARQCRIDTLPLTAWQPHWVDSGQRD